MIELNDIISLATCRPGETMRIVELKTTEDKTLQKLAVFGIIPGNEITLLQSRPAYVLQIEYTQLAIDYLLACTIYGYKLK